MPEHLRHWPGLYVRSGNRIVDATAADQSVAKCYPTWRNKGPSVRGMRLTIMTLKKAYAVGEEVRVLHVVEAEEPGFDVYVMGPKTVFGEEVDGILRTARPPSEKYPWFEDAYDGTVLTSPRSITTTRSRRTVSPSPVDIGSNGSSGISRPTC